MTAPVPAGDRVAAEQWFLRFGLPSVLTPRARWRRLWWRSAPALTALATVAVAVRIVTVASGGGYIDIDNDPTPAEWLIVAILVVVLPLAGAAAWWTSRIATRRGRRIALGASLLVFAVVDAAAGKPAAILAEVLSTAAAVAAVLLFNGSGAGSVVGWSIRLTLSHLKSVGALFTRALPVLLLTVLVFFNGPVWSMATTIGRGRLWLLIGFMVVLAGMFLCTGVVERVRPMLSAHAVRDVDVTRLEDTPFAALPDPAEGTDAPLSRGERANVVFVVAVSQFVQIAAVAAVTSVIFLIMGLLALTPQLLTRLTVDGSWQGTWMGMTLPIPQALIHVSMFLGALTFMYVSARSVGDGEYRKQFLDPLIDDLRAVLVARNRYRGYVTRLHRGL
ncbi:hypothetical protein [Mycolicibacterium sediminis]|uniref:Integral membrane protein n=1 Tax=Mycolicibacterium sediminis TaxID=1286180 RepID=A0A7I7QW18_9MYCO|nr:hypothetical protein [Mycolicibacterium sediminis]BBY30472.1 integral membrane protein [Mycolicibacterium sediminis]